MFRNRNDPRFYLLRGIALSILLVLAALVGNIWQMYHIGNQTPPAAATADAAVVFSAATWNKQPSPVFLGCINHTIALYRGHRAGKIALTGGTPKKGYMIEAEVGRRCAFRQGTPTKSILFENTSRNTYENLRNIRPILRVNSVGSIIIASNPYHLAHAQAITRGLGLNTEVSATPTTHFDAHEEKGRFLFQENYLLFLYQFENWGDRIWNRITRNG